MLVIQLTCGLFLVIMQAKYPKHTQEGLLLIWREYERDEKEMPSDDIRIDVDNVGSVFCEMSFFDFVEYEINCENHKYFPADLHKMNYKEVAEVKKEIQTFLGSKFIGFTNLNNVVYRH